MPAFLPSNQFSLLPLSSRDGDSESRFQWILLLLGCITAVFALGTLAQSRSTRPTVTRRVKGRRNSLSVNSPSPTPAPRAEARPNLPAISHENTTKNEETQGEESQNAVPQYSETNPLNLNTATAGQLEILPGVGPAMAEKILAVRDEKSGFKSVEDLGEVPGIGEKTMDKLRPLVAVS